MRGEGREGGGVVDSGWGEEATVDVGGEVAGRGGGEEGG